MKVYAVDVYGEIDSLWTSRELAEKRFAEINENSFIYITEYELDKVLWDDKYYVDENPMNKALDGI